MPIICCPKCESGDLQFEIHSDLQGVECWARVVETIELVNQECDCPFTVEEMRDLETRAYEIGDDYEPVYDFEFSDFESGEIQFE